MHEAADVWRALHSMHPLPRVTQPVAVAVQQVGLRKAPHLGGHGGVMGGVVGGVMGVGVG